MFRVRVHLFEVMGLHEFVGVSITNAWHCQSFRLMNVRFSPVIPAHWMAALLVVAKYDPRPQALRFSYIHQFGTPHTVHPDQRRSWTLRVAAVPLTRLPGS